MEVVEINVASHIVRVLVVHDIVLVQPDPGVEAEGLSEESVKEVDVPEDEKEQLYIRIEMTFNIEKESKVFSQFNKN
jgi:hypothetical protein